MIYYKIDGRFIEFPDDFVIDATNYPDAIRYTEQEKNVELAQVYEVPEERKKTDLKQTIRQYISEFDYVFLGDTDGYISESDRASVRNYRATLRNILNDFAKLTSAEISALIPMKPRIKHNKVDI